MFLFFAAFERAESGNEAESVITLYSERVLSVSPEIIELISARPHNVVSVLTFIAVPSQ